MWVTQNESNLILPELNACKFAETLMLKTKLHISFHLTITEIKIHKLITPGRGFHSGWFHHLQLRKIYLLFKKICVIKNSSAPSSTTKDKSH